MATARTAATTAADFLPATRRLTDLVAAARECRGCGLYENATQVVFGQGAEQGTHPRGVVLDRVGVVVGVAHELLREVPCGVRRVRRVGGAGTRSAEHG